MTNTFLNVMIFLKKSVADLRDTPLDRSFFIVMQFSGKIGQIIGWCRLEGWHPPLGNPGSPSMAVLIVTVDDCKAFKQNGTITVTVRLTVKNCHHYNAGASSLAMLPLCDRQYKL